MFATTSTPRPRRRDRLVARLRAGAIDRELIAGADIVRSPQLQARAARLTSRPARLALAVGLERLTATDARSVRRMRMRPPQESLRAAAPALRELVGLLRAPTPLYARGLAMLNELLADGGGPLYAGGGAAELGRALAEVRTALAEPRPTGSPQWDGAHARHSRV
jgi:hypothetical protein